MRKVIVVIALLVAVIFTARPYVRVIVDDGIAGVMARSSVSQKFETVAVWYW